MAAAAIGTLTFSASLRHFSTTVSSPRRCSFVHQPSPLATSAPSRRSTTSASSDQSQKIASKSSASIGGPSGRLASIGGPSGRLAGHSSPGTGTSQQVYVVSGEVWVVPNGATSGENYMQFVAGDLVRYPKWFEADLFFDEPYEERYQFLAYGEG